MDFTIYVQADAPPKERRTNWLSALMLNLLFIAVLIGQNPRLWTVHGLRLKNRVFYSTNERLTHLY
jgi:hypothetical protein